MNSRKEFLEEVEKVRKAYIESQRMGTGRFKAIIDLVVKYDQMYEYIKDGGILPPRERLIANLPCEQAYFETLTELGRKKYFEEIEELKRRS